MDIQIKHTQAVATDADTIILYLLQDDAEGDAQAAAVGDGVIAKLRAAGDVTGKAESTVVTYLHDGDRVRRLIIVGLGASDGVTAETVRRATAVGLRQARDLGAKHVASALPTVLPTGEAAQAVIEGGLMGLYYYHGQRTSPAPENRIDSLTLAVESPEQIGEAETGSKTGRAFADGALLARDLVNLPPNICTPAYLAQRAQEMSAAVGLKCDVLEEKQMRTLKMGALLAVAQGSTNRPRFIVMEHNAKRAAELETVVLVGKGVTFDTGGYSLKTKDGMIGMKADMGGGAAVIGAMHAVAALDVDVHVVGLVPAADNMISGAAYRPQDVITASNGKTIEIISTDAEGRMLLADALVYAARYEPKAVVDIATLTGACVTALGSAAAGLFSIDDGLRDALLAAASATSERVWPLPLYPEYDKAIESQTADIKNSGGAKNGVGTSAAFLRNFVSYPAWAHIDMAGMMLDADGVPYIPVKGGTGYGARLLAQFARMWATKGAN